MILPPMRLGRFGAASLLVALLLAPGWLSNERFVLITVILVICWATMGSGVLFYSSGLAALPPSYAEAG